MLSSSSSFSAKLTLITVAALFLCSTAFGQGDPDPNSPTPYLITLDTSAEARIGLDDGVRTPRARGVERVFTRGSMIVLYVANVRLADGEGPKAFRVYAEASGGRLYRFPVEDISSSDLSRNLLALKVRLDDELRFWELPDAETEIQGYLTWRGLSSNKVIFARGSGTSSESAGLEPFPLGKALSFKGSASGANPEYIGYRWSGDRMRFMKQATFGPTMELDSRLRRIGLRTWLAEQFEAPYPSAANPYPNQPLKPANAPSDCDGNQTVPDVPVTCFRDTYTMYPLQTWFFREALYGDAQLRHKVAWALSQIWVTSGVDIQQSRHMVEYHKVLSQNAFGNYRDLMYQMTLHPTMGEYLDMVRSTRNSPNENYARELMQLFSVGLFKLNQNGTTIYENGEPAPTYTQEDVNNLTKVLTGWTFCNQAATCPNLVSGAVNHIDPMRLNTNNHDLTAKTLLAYQGSTTTNIAACTNCTNATNTTTYAFNSLNQAIDNLFYHPNVGPFVSKLLIQHLVTSDPTPQYVSDVAAIFNNNGAGVRGDLRSVVRAVLLHPEARGDRKTDPNYGKLMEPVQLTTSFLRAFNVRGAVAGTLSDGFLTGRAEFTGMGQNPFRSPTVFNYYPPDFVVPGTSLLGPEFALMTTGTSIQRANFSNRFVFTAPAIAGGTTDAPNGTAVDFSDLQALSTADPTGNLLLDELNKRLMHYTMSEQMRNTIRPVVTTVNATDPLGRVRQAVYLVTTSSQYQVQR